MFGFTFMIWQHFYKKLIETGYLPNLSKGVLIHGGGWKKLVNEKVSPIEYKKRLNEVCGILPENIHDYYGWLSRPVVCIWSANAVICMLLFSVMC